MNVVTDIQKSDLLWLHLHLLPRLRGNWIFVGAIALAVIVWAAYTSTGPITGKKLAISIFAGLVGGLVGLLITTTINFLAILAHSSKKAGVLGRHEYEIRADGLFERTTANEQLSKWSGIADIERTGSFIFVSINGYLFHIIPSRSFASEREYDDFFSKLRATWRSTAA
jgi:YcxB-like protein